jgi:uncharacterized protein YjbI with pentapeptide repeats
VRRLFFDVTRVAPFLRSERGALHLASLQAREPMTSGAGQTLADRDSAGATLNNLEIAGSTVLRWRAPGAALIDVDSAGATWEVVDLERAVIRHVNAPDAHLALVSLREATLEDSDLSGSQFVLCDLGGATLRRVKLDGCRLHGCDASGATFDGTSFEKTDLRGTVLRGAFLVGADLSSADVMGADLRHAALSPEQRADLKARGARVGGGWLYRLWAGALGASTRPERHQRARAAVTATWAALAVLVPVLFFARAALNPVNPNEPPFWQHEGEEPEDQPQPEQ